MQFLSGSILDVVNKNEYKPKKEPDWKAQVDKHDPLSLVLAFQRALSPLGVQLPLETRAPCQSCNGSGRSSGCSAAGFKTVRAGGLGLASQSGGSVHSFGWGFVFGIYLCVFVKNPSSHLTQSWLWSRGPNLFAPRQSSNLEGMESQPGPTARTRKFLKGLSLL